MSQSLTSKQSMQTVEAEGGANTSLLARAASEVLALAKQQGATQAAVMGFASQGFNVTVRMREVDSVEHQRDQSISLVLYFGQRKGEVSSSDLSRDALKQAVEKAHYIAHYMAEDPCYGLPEVKQLATQFPDLQLDHPWQITTEEAIALAERCEILAQDHD